MGQEADSSDSLSATTNDTVVSLVYEQAYHVLEQNSLDMGQLVDWLEELCRLSDWITDSSQWKIGSEIRRWKSLLQFRKSDGSKPLFQLAESVRNDFVNWRETADLAPGRDLLRMPSATTLQSVKETHGPSEAAKLVRAYLPQLRDALAQSIKDLELLLTWAKEITSAIELLLRSGTWVFGDIILVHVFRPLLRRGTARGSESLKAFDTISKNLVGVDAVVRQRLQYLAPFEAWLGPVKSDILGLPPLNRMVSFTKALPTLAQTDRVHTIIVPVYDAYEDLMACVDSLLLHTDPRHKILLIDDASADQRVWPSLKKIAERHPNVEALQNHKNEGFTRTVNRGLRDAVGDVVLLNSDTILTSRWLDKLERAAYSQARVATVTPLTDNGSVFSVPKINSSNELPEFLTINMMADIVERLSQHLFPAVPTGNGFCLYITHDALEAVGEFNAKGFPDGYGEENDFCMQASSKGFRHLIDDTTFIHHRESASYKERKKKLMARSLKIINQLYPGYNAKIREWVSKDPLLHLRHEIHAIYRGHHSVPLMSYLCDDERKTFLFFTHDGTGGAIHHADLLAKSFSHKNRCLIVRLGLKKWTLGIFCGSVFQTVEEYSFSDTWSLKDKHEGERRVALRDILARFKPDLVHIHHMIGLAPEALDEIRENSPVILFSMHDFYAICPSYNLLDDTYTFCSGHCTDGEGDCLEHNVWLEAKDLKHKYVATWRERFTPFLNECDAIVSFTHFAARLLQDHFSRIEKSRIQIIPHGQDTLGFESSLEPLSSEPIRVVLIGALDPAKGTILIEKVMKLNREQAGPFQFHFVGGLHPGFDPTPYGGIVHGPYIRSELPEILKRIAPSLAMFASICPETYSFTLGECWAAHIPVLVSNLGALEERVKENGGGWILDHRSAIKWYQEMVRIASDPEAYTRQVQIVKEIELKSEYEMLSQYSSLYDRLLEFRSQQREESDKASAMSIAKTVPAELHRPSRSK